MAQNNGKLELNIEKILGLVNANEAKDQRGPNLFDPSKG